MGSRSNLLDLPPNAKESIYHKLCVDQNPSSSRLVCKETRNGLGPYVLFIRPRAISLQSGKFIRKLFPNVTTLDLGGLYEETVYGGAYGWNSQLHTSIEYKLNRDTIRSFNQLSRLRTLVVSCKNLMSVWDLLNLLPHTEHALVLEDVTDSVLDAVINMIPRARNLEKVTLSASLSSFNAFKLLKFVEKHQSSQSFVIDLKVNTHTVNDPEGQQVEQLMLNCLQCMRSISWSGSYIVDPASLARIAAGNAEQPSILQKVQIECMHDIQWQNLSSQEVQSLVNIQDFRIQLQRTPMLKVLKKKGIDSIKALYMHPIWSDQMGSFLQSLPDFPKLLDLRLECNVLLCGLPISKEQFDAMMQLTQLTCLKMRSVNLDLDLSDFMKLTKLYSLRKLSIRNSVIGFNQDLLPVINRMTWLRSLELEQGGFNSFNYLTPICRLTSLTKLKLRPVLQSALEHQNQPSVILNFKKLQKLELGITWDQLLNSSLHHSEGSGSFLGALKKELQSLRRLRIQ